LIFDEIQTIMELADKRARARNGDLTIELTYSNHAV